MKYRTIYRETTVKWIKLRIKSMIWNLTKQRTRRRKKNPKIENSVSSLWDNFKRSNICNIGVKEGEEEEEEIRNVFEKIMKENFPNLVKETGMHA